MVIDVAFLHAKHLVQALRGIEGVAHPFDVADIVLLTFLYADIDVDVFLLAVGHHAVCHNDGVAVTQFAILREQVLFCFLVLVLHELLASEPSGEGVLVVYLLQYAWLDKVALYLSVAQVVVAGDVDAIDSYLVFLLYVDIHDDLVGGAGVVVLYDVYLCVLVAFV